jgi:hypothetical protein
MPGRLKPAGIFSTAFDPVARIKWRKAGTALAAFSPNAGKQPGRFIEGLNITR